MFYQQEPDSIPYYFCKLYSTTLIFPPHIHYAFEFVTVFSGTTKIIVDGIEYNLTKGESMLIFPFQIHSRRSENSECKVAIFSCDCVDSFWSLIAEQIPLNNKFIPSDFLINEFENVSQSSPLVEKKAYLYSVCAEFNKNARYKKRENLDGSALMQMFKFIENKYSSEACSLNRLALENHYNSSYLSRIFKKQTGIAFNSYVNWCRINKACYLLDNSDKSILECAYECGFASLRSFNRNFRIHRGMSPGEYRCKNG